MTYASPEPTVSTPCPICGTTFYALHGTDLSCSGGSEHEHHPPARFFAGAVAPSSFPGDPVEIPREVVEGPPKWKCETPPSAFLYSLNGFDEIAVAQRFGAPILSLREDPVQGGRALAFVHLRRLGKNDNDAWNDCMALTMQEVIDYFHPEPKADPVRAEGNSPE